MSDPSRTSFETWCLSRQQASRQQKRWFPSSSHPFLCRFCVQEHWWLSPSRSTGRPSKRRSWDRPRPKQRFRCHWRSSFQIAGCRKLYVACISGKSRKATNSATSGIGIQNARRGFCQCSGQNWLNDSMIFRIKHSLNDRTWIRLHRLHNLTTLRGAPIQPQASAEHHAL